MSALVSKTLRYSCVDGPGNRLVVFVQGCNFACPTCHNPHTRGVCNDCGDCVPACPRGALALVAGHIAFDAAACDGCDACLRACPISANPMVQHLEVADILTQVRANLPFLSGITLSGGEVLTQRKFLTALFAAMAAAPDLAHLTRLIDSNGHLGAAGWRGVLAVTDGVMLDIKAFDPALHRTLTGRDNRLSLASARLLARAGKLHELRLLLIPGKTDTAAELAGLVALVRELGLATRVRLNAFQHHGVQGAARDWPKMTRARMDEVADQLRAAGLRQVVTPTVWL